MELHHLRHFVTTAETLNYGQAATRLGIAQPALSRSIQRLEQLLGAKLFERNRRHVSLTAAGQVLLEEAREVLSRARLAERLTRKAAQGDVNQLSVSFIHSALFRLLPRVIRAFRDQYPEIEISLKERLNYKQIEGLREGRFDIGFVHMPILDEKGLATRVIERSRYVIAIPSSWPLARLKKLKLAQLADVPFVMPPEEISPTAYAAIRSACVAAGFTPKVVQEGEQTHTLLSLVSAGLGVALVVESARFIAGEGISFVPIEDAPDTLFRELGAVWLPRSVVARPLKLFLNVLFEVAALPMTDAPPSSEKKPSIKLLAPQEATKLLP